VTIGPAHAEDALIEPQEDNRKALRARLRAARAALDPNQAAAASHVTNSYLVHSAEFLQAHRIAGYVAVGNEADPEAALVLAHELGKSVYLPRIRPERRLVFAQWQPGDTLHKHTRLGIPEPAAGAPTIRAEQLDLVIVPLVGFDAEGHRLGMGGGFYDRNFAFRQAPPVTRPILAGFAHANQICQTIPPEPWDTPLDLVVTEQGIRRFPMRHNETSTD